MHFTLMPGIEYAVFLAAVPIALWKPRFSTGVILGGPLSTLYAIPGTDGCVWFYSHDYREMQAVAPIIEQHFLVEVVAI